MPRGRHAHRNNRFCHYLTAMRPAIIIASTGIIFVAGCNIVTRPYRTAQAAEKRSVEALGATLVEDSLGRLLVHAQIDGTPGLFLVDTGTTRSALFAGFADRIGLPIQPSTRHLVVSQGTLTPKGMVMATLQVAGTSACNRQLDVVPDQQMRKLEKATMAPTCDGVIGCDILSEFEAEIDIPDMTLRLPATARPVNEQVVARLHRVSENTTVAVYTTVNGTDACFALDTGAREYGSIGSNRPIYNGLPHIQGQSLLVYTGETTRVENTRLRVFNFTLGSLKAQNVDFDIESDFLHAKTAGIGRRTIDGMIGLRFLREFELIVDLGRMEIRRAASARKNASAVPHS